MGGECVNLPFSEFYDAVAGRYDELMLTGESALEDEIALAATVLGEPKSVLDVGCGTGRIAVALQEMGYDVTGLDSSSAMIELAREKGLLKTKVAEFSPGYRIGTFQAVISLHMGFSYICAQHKVEMMAETLWQHLDPGGTVLWDTPNREFYGSVYELKWPGNEGLVTTRCFGHCKEELIGTFESVGFAIGRVWGSYSPQHIFTTGCPRIIIEATR